MTLIISIIVFIFTILVLVVIHEFGHFIAAKKFGIKVLEFGFGLPPRVMGKKYGETLVSLNWLPFGGFVKLLGEDEVDKNILENKRSFAYQNVWKRIAVVVAGVLMNLLLAWALFYTVLIAQNFRIIYPSLEPAIVIEEIEPGFPAENSGLLKGDKIIKVDGQNATSIEQAISKVKTKPDNEPVTLIVTDIDGNNLREIKIVPKKLSDTEKRIGVAFSPVPFKEYNTPAQKAFSGILYSYDATRYTFLGLGRLFNDVGQGNFQRASESVAGPIGLASITKDIVEIGREATLFYLWFVGIMSLTLTIFNILPIPALDGGRLFFLLVEAVTKKKISPQLEKAVHAVGMAILLTLIFIISFSDIWKVIT